MSETDETNPLTTSTQTEHTDLRTPRNNLRSRIQSAALATGLALGALGSHEGVASAAAQPSSGSSDPEAAQSQLEVDPYKGVEVAFNENDVQLVQQLFQERIDVSKNPQFAQLVNRLNTLTPDQQKKILRKEVQENQYLEEGGQYSPDLRPDAYKVVLKDEAGNDMLEVWADTHMYFNDRDKGVGVTGIKVNLGNDGKIRPLKRRGYYTNSDDYVDGDDQRRAIEQSVNPAITQGMTYRRLFGKDADGSFSTTTAGISSSGRTLNLVEMDVRGNLSVYSGQKMQTLPSQNP